MVIFRENTEDIYAGIEYAGGTPEARRCSTSWPRNFRKTQPRFASAQSSATKTGSSGTRIDRRPKARHAGRGRHRHQTDQPAGHRATGAQRDQLRDSKQTQERDAGPQRQHHEIHRRWISRLGLPGGPRFLRRRRPLDGGPWHKIPDGKPGGGIIIKDVIADAFLQQILTRPADYDVVATPNLNGDYISDALPPASAASASHPARTSITSPATPSSKPRTARPRNTPTRTR